MTQGYRRDEPRNILNEGERYGRLVVNGPPVLTPRKDGRRRSYYPVVCDCGTNALVLKSNLTSGNTTSCGCIHRERVSELMTTHGATRGRKTPRLYRVWKAMRDRCNRPTASNYRWYGGKGISVCPEWGDYTVFSEWALANGYDDTLTIDRIDSAKDYAPENCRWVSLSENVRRSRQDKARQRYRLLSD